MPKSNIHILTEDERKYFNEKYTFVVKDHAVLVKVKDYDRTTAHPLTQKFTLKTILRKLTISVEALQLWSERFHKKYKSTTTNDDVYTLIDVQNAINMLIVSYQSISFENVYDILKRQIK